MGNRVRYDGDHQYHAWIVEVLGQFVDLVPICPEVEIGLGVPRPAIHLVQQQQQVEAIGVEDGQLNVTQSLISLAQELVPQFEQFSGYIFKSSSPSCGISHVRLTDEQGRETLAGTGIFADTVMRLNPDLPVVDEQGLADQSIKEQFLIRLFSEDR